MASIPQLTIQMRRKQLQDIYGTNVTFSGTTPLTLVASPGSVDATWVDYTDFTEGLDKITLSFSTVQDGSGDLSAGEFVPKKGASGTLTFERDAYDFIQAWLVNDVASPLNGIEVQITDASCGAWTQYVIYASQLSWCEFNSICVFQVNLKQEDPNINCIQRTLIADNWQGWFQPPFYNAYTGTYKKHPRFGYCIEHRPNAILIIEFMLLSVIEFIFLALMIPMLAVFTIIYWLLSGINSVLSFLGGKGPDDGPLAKVLSAIPTIADLNNIISAFNQQYVEAAGCGREHPAPLIRDYISNVCDKCGIKYNALTIPIFFSPVWPEIPAGSPFGFPSEMYDSNTNDMAGQPNPYYNACLLTAQVVRGVRRFQDWGTNPDTTTFYLPDNAPVWALSDMLDYLKKLFNCQWRVEAIYDGTSTSPVPYLFFKRKDWYEGTEPLFDFSIGGADRSKLIAGVCYEPTDYKLPASCGVLYTDDPADKCGHEALLQMNGVPLSFVTPYGTTGALSKTTWNDYGNPVVNPLYDGILDKHADFGATKFCFDGASTDYVYDAIQVCLIADFMNPFLYAEMNGVVKAMRKYHDYALLLQNETTAYPKVLIWDPQSTNPADYVYLNARAVATQYAVPGAPAPPPDNNPGYPILVDMSTDNLTMLIPWTQAQFNPWDYNNPPQSHVIGQLGSSGTGQYVVSDPFKFVYSDKTACLLNYPMYFQPYYNGTLWDYFHWIDDPNRNPKLHKNWNLKIPLCCEDLNTLGLPGDGSACQLLGHVTLDTPFYNDGVITEINICYDVGGSDGGSSQPTLGQYIELKGYV